MVFPVVTYSCENWIVKKPEHQRIDAFELWCWRRFLKVPGTARSNLLILREINPECLFEGLILKLKLQYFGHLMQTADSLEKSLMLGKTEDRRRRGHYKMRRLDGITDVMDRLGQTLGYGEEQGALACCSSQGCKESDMTERLNKNIIALQSCVSFCCAAK